MVVVNIQQFSYAFKPKFSRKKGPDWCKTPLRKKMVADKEAWEWLEAGADKEEEEVDEEKSAEFQWVLI